jgi:amino acid transporter
VIAVTAGVAAPLTILAGAVAVVFLAFTVAEFTKLEPSAGSFITYVETSLGPRAGVATAVLVAIGYTVAIAGVFTMSGGMVAMTVAHYTSQLVSPTGLRPAGASVEALRWIRCLRWEPPVASYLRSGTVCIPAVLRRRPGTSRTYGRFRRRA